MHGLITTLIRWLSGISGEQWKLVLELVVKWATEPLTGAQKWQAVKDALKGQGLLSDKANFAIELAVQYAKKKGWIE